jgi:SAM-dependent methyltransferase
MPEADDHELILRTWLAGAKMVHLDHCLYLYRAENNTWLSERNAEIQQMTQRNYRRHLEPVALKWARDNDLLALDLCGGINPRAGFASVDVLPSADIRHDLNVFPWPFADGSVGVVRACDALEHLRDKHRVMTEIHRVLAPGGFLLSFTPSALGQGGCQDPTHVSGWVRNSFYYYTDAQFAQYIHNHSVRFLTHCLVEEYPTDWHKQHGILYVTFEGQALKGDGSRLPGNVKI